METRSAGGDELAGAATLGPEKVEATSGGSARESAHRADSQPTSSTPFRVLHLSDIHFGGTFDTSAWNYVRALARREKPDLLVCTGDLVNHGGLFMLCVARVQLEELRREVGEHVLLRCVRGNHDCGPWGNINLRPFSTNFAAVFGPSGMTLPKWVPSFTTYRQRSWLRKLWTRVLGTPALYAVKWVAALSRWSSGESLTYLPLTRADDPQQLVLIYLDSNATQWLATGNVDAREVSELKAHLLNLRDEPGARPFVPRIALMHHHPLPIPEASIKEGLTSFEPFLVLRNAGLVLRELNRCDVDLVLHGHKHYSAFGRLGYSVDHQVEGEIAVMAAGSSGVTISEPGRNSVNIIDIHETGRMSYAAIFFGGGGGEQVNELFRGKRDVHGMEMHKARVHRRASERQRQWVERITHAVAIDAGGVALVRHDVVGHCFERTQLSESVPVYIDVSMGRVPHTTLQLSEGSKRAGHTWVGKPTAPTRAVRCSINLGHRLSTSPPVSYGYQYLCFNTYAVTEWETLTAVQRDERQKLARGRVAGLEFAAYVVRVPVRNLSVRIQLPNYAVPAEPFVQVMRWSTYPVTDLDEARNFVDRTPGGRWVLDTDLTAHESGNLKHLGSSVYELNIAYPLVGHRYDIRWRVRSPDVGVPARRIETARRGHGEAYREALMGLVEDDGLRRALEDWTNQFREFLLASYAALLPNPDDLHVATFVYDQANQELRRVLHSRPDDQEGGGMLAVPLGEGVIGAAFKRSEFVMYIDPELTGSTADGAYLYENAPEGKWRPPKWRYVAAFPLFAFDEPVTAVEGLSFEGWGPQTTVGVLTIASTASDSGLLSLTTPQGEDEDGTGDDEARESHGASVQVPTAQAGTELSPSEDSSPGQTSEASASPRAATRLTALQLWGAAHLLLAYLSQVQRDRVSGSGLASGDTTPS